MSAFFRECWTIDCPCCSSRLRDTRQEIERLGNKFAEFSETAKQRDELLARLKEASVLLLECGATDKTLDAIDTAIARAEKGKS